MPISQSNLTAAEIRETGADIAAANGTPLDVADVFRPIQVEPPKLHGEFIGDGCEEKSMGWLELYSENLTVDWRIVFGMNTVGVTRLLRTGPVGATGLFVPYGGIESINYKVLHIQSNRSVNPNTYRWNAPATAGYTAAVRAAFFAEGPSSFIGSRYSLEWYSSTAGTFPADFGAATSASETFVGFAPLYARKAFIDANENIIVRTYSYADTLVGESSTSTSFEIDLDSASYITIQADSADANFSVSWRAQ